MLKRFLFILIFLLPVSITGFAQMPEAIDLGLSVKWASFNLGAAEPYQLGNFYAWGETTHKSWFDWSNYKWGQPGHLTKYDSKAVEGEGYHVLHLELQDDAAHTVLGGKWRMPTIDEAKELLKNCEWAWVCVNGIYGYQGTSKINGNRIFLPPQLPQGESHERLGAVVLWTAGNNGKYHPNDAACIVLMYNYFFSTHDRIFIRGEARMTGYPIRAVKP